MDLRRKPNGGWELRWREGGRRRARTFDRKSDAVRFEADRVRRKQLGHAAVPDDVPLCEFVETYWRLHAVPNLAKSTREFYLLTWTNHIMPRLGDYGVRELTPKRLARFREELEKAGVGTATVRKAMAILQSILSFAVAEELVEFNVAASVRKPRYERERDPHIFLPEQVEEIRGKLTSLRDRTLVSLLAYSGPRPEEVVCRLAWEDIGERAIRYRDTKRHRIRFTPLLTPLAEDLREWFLASGRPAGRQPVIPAHDGGFWSDDDWRNWRSRIWRRGAPGKPAQRADLSRRRAGRHPAARPALELHHGPGVRRRPAHDDRQAVRHERDDDRAALRRGDRELGRRADHGRASNQGRPPPAAQADHRVSPIRDADARRRYHREWIARRRAEFFAGKTCLDCGTTEQLELDRRDTTENVNHRLWSWSSTRREAELAKYDVRCSACRRDRLAERQMRHGTRGRYEKGCRCEACRQAKSRRNAQYREQHKDKLTETRRPRRKTTRASRSASGIVGVYHVPEASRSKPWRAQISVGKRLIHLGMFATRDEAAAARAAAEQDRQRT